MRGVFINGSKVVNGLGSPDGRGFAVELPGLACPRLAGELRQGSGSSTVSSFERLGCK